MSARSSEPETAIPAPRETTGLFGHRDAEQTLLAAYRSLCSPIPTLLRKPYKMPTAFMSIRIIQWRDRSPTEATAVC